MRSATFSATVVLLVGILLATKTLAQIIDPTNPTVVASSQDIEPSNPATTSPPSLLDAREVQIAEVTTTTTVRRPVYNNYALNCFDDRAITQSCLADPYKYYCDSKGKLRYSGRPETDYCKWCDCVDMDLKPRCILNLIGVVNCARGLEVATDVKWHGMKWIELDEDEKMTLKEKHGLVAREPAVAGKQDIQGTVVEGKRATKADRSPEPKKTKPVKPKPVKPKPKKSSATPLQPPYFVNKLIAAIRMLPRGVLP